MQTKPQAKQKPGVKLSIADAIAKGLCDEAAAAARELLETMPPLDVVEKELIPALDAVGEQYEKQIIFLPQLMNAAAASGAAFDEVRRVIGQSSAAGEGKGPIVLATVEGDIHDIGKTSSEPCWKKLRFSSCRSGARRTGGARGRGSSAIRCEDRRPFRADDDDRAQHGKDDCASA